MQSPDADVIPSVVVVLADKERTFLATPAGSPARSPYPPMIPVARSAQSSTTTLDDVLAWIFDF